MKKFLDKLKKALPFGKDKVSDKEIEDSIDEYEDNFLDGDQTDPDLEIPPPTTLSDNDSTQPDLSILNDSVNDESLANKSIPGVINQDTISEFRNTTDKNEGSDTDLLSPGSIDSSENNGTQEIDTEEIPVPIAEALDPEESIETDPNEFNDKTHWRDRGTSADIPNLPKEEVDEEILDIKDSGKVSVVSKIKNLFKRKKKTAPVYYDEDLNFEEIVPASKPKKKSKKLSTGSLSFLSFFQWLFSVESRPKIHRYFLIVLFLLFFFSIGKIIGLFVSGTTIPKIAEPAPIESKGSKFNRQQLNAFTAQDVFNAKEVVRESVEKTPDQINRDEICLKADSKTSFPYYLLNTIVLQNASKSLAAIKVRSNPTLLELREGEEIESKARIDRIGRLRAIIKNYNTGACEYIENSDATAPPKNINVLSKTDSQAKKQQLEDIQGIQNDGNSTVIERDFLNKQLANISGLLSQALAIPVNNPDGTVAFRITEIEPGSIYSYLNIQNGDTITEINGKKIATQNEVLNLFGKLKTIKKLQLTVNRGGTSTPLDYTFK